MIISLYQKFTKFIHFIIPFNPFFHHEHTCFSYLYHMMLVFFSYISLWSTWSIFGSFSTQIAAVLMDICGVTFSIDGFCIECFRFSKPKLPLSHAFGCHSHHCLCSLLHFFPCSNFRKPFVLQMIGFCLLLRCKIETWLFWKFSGSLTKLPIGRFSFISVHRRIYTKLNWKMQIIKIKET